MKNKLGLILISMILVSSMAFANGSKEEEKYPSKPITLIVPFGAGGGTDTGARILMTYVEDELGVPVTIINKTGGTGWVGWSELLKSDPDGYTLAHINTPTLMTGYLNPQLKRSNTIHDFELIANHVLDYGAIAIRIDEKKFSNLDELISFAKNK